MCDNTQLVAADVMNTFTCQCGEQEPEFMLFVHIILEIYCKKFSWEFGHGRAHLQSQHLEGWDRRVSSLTQPGLHIQTLSQNQKQTETIS
jgi:hypothetical protein